MRVVAIDYGKLEQGMIEVHAIEDAFAVAYSAYDPPDDSAWVDPIGDPEAPAAQVLQEAPFEWLSAPTDGEKVLVGAVRAEGASRQYKIWADEGSGYFESGQGEYFAPSGLVTADYLRTTAALDATGFTLESGQDLEGLAGTDAAGRIRGDCLLLFLDTEEICAFETVTDNEDGTFTFTNIVRGVYDTFPADHPEGTRVIVLRDAATWYLFPYREDLGDEQPGEYHFIVEED
jgi:hypothetical protein